MIQLGLVGYPLGHSLSPRIHTAALKACGLRGEYSLFLISPDDLHGLKALLARLRSNEICGVNVTIPHKQNVIPLLDELTPTAQSIGAVNTIAIKNGKLIGENTDAPGFLADLKRFLTLGTNKKKALVLGAGGSARAVVYALVNDGWDVTVAARRMERAKKMENQFTVQAIAMADIRSIAFDLIVNATPVGMFPNIDASPWPAELFFAPNTAVYDLVYNPRETRLVSDALAAGLDATTGLGMLIEQAALAFEIWTGFSIDRHLLFEAVGEL